MNPVDRSWTWWKHLLDIPFWDPWLAGLTIVIFVFCVFYLIGRLLRP